MGHKCFISFKKEDQWYRDQIDKLFASSDLINKGLDRVINSDDGDYIMKAIRQEYLKDSTVTIFLIGTHSSENEGLDYMGRRKNSNENYKRRCIMASVIPETGFWELSYQRCMKRSIKALTNVPLAEEPIIMSALEIQP